MNTYHIRAKQNLHNSGQCFTKDKIYTVITGHNVTTEAGLMDCNTVNDLGERHTIGSWWREFTLIVGEISELPAERFKPDSFFQQSNGGGIELMLNVSCDGVYYRWSYGQDLTNEPIFEAEIETDETGSYFMHGDTRYSLNNFMKV
jgi:hypothetical protein